MALTRLKNVFTSKTGRCLYVNSDDFDASDSFDNRGNSPNRPFKSIQRALIEAARFSYKSGQFNDTFESFSIVLYPGDYVIDNNGVELLVSSVTKATTEQFIVNDLAVADNEVKEISGILLGTYQSLYVESTGAVTFTLVGLEEQAEIPS